MKTVQNIQTTHGVSKDKHVNGAGMCKANDLVPSPAERNYDSCVVNGFYQRDTGGLCGKYDNVRKYWEDQMTRYALRDFVDSLVAMKRRSLSRIRVLDLGAGSGEGYELLTSLKKGTVSVASREVDVLPAEMLACYKGIDLSEAMVTQGQGIYANDPKVQFVCQDLSKGLGHSRDDSPYDIYFSSYGSLSHLRDEELRKLIEDMCDHFEDSCIFVGDLVGKYSFEWQCYWDPSENKTDPMRPYSMSYLYPRELLGSVELESFSLRYWGAEEFDTFFTEVVKNKDVKVSKRKISDRSLLVGRHMNTAEFNPHAQPIREAVNSLHEFNRRTDLENLIFDYVPHPNFPELNRFYEGFQMAWNAVVHAAIEALEKWEDAIWLEKSPNDEYPDIVQESIRTIRNAVRNVQWFRMGDPRANVIEPQLGYILRNLEMDLQKGLGTGHGLLAIYQLHKD